MLSPTTTPVISTNSCLNDTYTLLNTVISVVVGEVVSSNSPTKSQILDFVIVIRFCCDSTVGAFPNDSSLFPRPEGLVVGEFPPLRMCVLRAQALMSLFFQNRNLSSSAHWPSTFSPDMFSSCVLHVFIFYHHLRHLFDTIPCFSFSLCP